MSKVLIVDDEPSMRITLTTFLKMEGYEAFNAPSAKTALEFISENIVDVIVTDIIMPGMTGIELMDRVRAFSSDIRFIVMTGEPTVETAVSAVQQGASDYLAKPIRRDDFLRAVDNWGDPLDEAADAIVQRHETISARDDQKLRREMIAQIAAIEAKLPLN